MMAPYGTKASVAEKIVAESRISGGELKIERVTELIGPLADGLNDSVKTLHRMIKEEGDWRFNLGDGISVKVNFSADPSKAHLAAFVKVFSAMAEAYVEAAAQKEEL